MKRLLTLALALLMLGSLLPTLASADSAPRGKITATIYDRGRVPASEGTIEENRWTEWINENGPVDVEFVAVPRTNPQDKLYVLFASGTAPDLIFEYSPTIRHTLYYQGQLMPVESMIEQYSVNYKEMLEAYPGLRTAGLMPDGELYAFGKVNASNFTRAVLIRQDWLDALGLEAPVTMEDYYEVSRAFVEDDPDGNGVRDTYAFAMSWRAGETFNQMFYGDVIMELDDQMQYGWDQIALRLEFKKWLYDNSYIDREFMSDTNGAKAMQDFLTGKTGILPWLTSIERTFALNEMKTFKDNNPNGKLAALQYPTLPHGEFVPTVLNPLQITAFVNANAKDPESVMKYIDFSCSEEFATALKYGIEGVHFAFEDGMPVVTDTDLFTNEVSWAGDFSMLVSAPTMAKFQSDTDTYDLSDPFEAEIYEIRKQAIALYLDPTRGYAGLTHSEHMPQLPEELSMINANINLNEYFDRAVVGGTAYTVEQAMEDAKNAWTQSEGDLILAWWQNWYENDRENAFLADDIFEIIMKGYPLDYLK